ncbi:MAG: PEP-CTERM sorting domain-containing protein, partial [Thermoguttaceae bacterium]|nr:PEP-CTERM sorting domain-containing protein [Thermoguttaceae bacterium]
SFPPAFSSILKQKSFYSEKTILFTFIMSYFSQKISEKNRFRKWKLNNVQFQRLFIPPPRILTFERILVLALGLLALTANLMADVVERYNSKGELTASGSDIYNVQFADGYADGDIIKVSEGAIFLPVHTFGNSSDGYNNYSANNFTLQGVGSSQVNLSDYTSDLRFYNLSSAVTSFTLKNVIFGEFGAGDLAADFGAVINVPNGATIYTDNVTFSTNFTRNDYYNPIYPYTAGGAINGCSHDSMDYDETVTLTIIGTTTFEYNGANYGGAIFANNLTFSGNGSVGTFTNNDADYGSDLYVQGALTFQDAGSYNFDGGIYVGEFTFEGMMSTPSTPSTSIDKAQVTIAGRAYSEYNGEYKFDGGINISNGGKLTAKLDDIDKIENTTITLNDDQSLVELTNETQNQTATIKSSTGSGAFVLEYTAANGLVQAESFVISSGRIDAKGAMEAAVNVQSDATFSPGNSVGRLEVTGDVAIASNGVALFEFSSYSEGRYDELIVNNGSFTANNSTIQLYFESGDAQAWADSLDDTGYQLVADNGFSTGDFSTWLKNYTNLFSLTGRSDGLYLTANVTPENITPDTNAVPEPSTWALLALGVVVLFLRKRVRN